MATILYTSLAEIKSFNPCFSGWKAILTGQGKSRADDISFPLIECLNSNSISDVCWLLGKRKTEVAICVNFAKKCAESVRHLKSTLAAASAASSAAAYAASADAYASSAAYAAASAAAADAYAASAAASAAIYAAYASSAAAYAAKQKELNKQFLIDSIKEWEGSH